MPSTTSKKKHKPFDPFDMIITILPSSANFHAVAYNEMKVEKGVATLLEAQNILGPLHGTHTSKIPSSMWL